MSSLYNKIALLIFALVQCIYSNPSSSFIFEKTSLSFATNGNLNPKLTFVGQINGKSYYHVTNNVNYAASKAHCENLGMNLATFDSLTETNFVSDRIPVSYTWTGAVDKFFLSSFVWAKGQQSIPNHSYAIFPNSDVGLALYPGAGAGRTLTQMEYTTNLYSLCMLQSGIQRDGIPSITKDQAPIIIQTIETQNKSKDKVFQITPLESGHPSLKYKIATPKFEFIGNINGKYFYYGTTPMGQLDSSHYCDGLGMELAYFDSTVESSFVYERIPSGYFWVSGEQKISLNYFAWWNGGAIPASHQHNAYYSSILGLTFSGSSDFPRYLVQTNWQSLYLPICLLNA